MLGRRRPLNYQILLPLQESSVHLAICTFASLRYSSRLRQIFFTPQGFNNFIFVLFLSGYTSATCLAMWVDKASTGCGDAQPPSIIQPTHKIFGQLHLGG
jgi:hypothetical protein